MMVNGTAAALHSVSDQRVLILRVRETKGLRQVSEGDGEQPEQDERE